MDEPLRRIFVVEDDRRLRQSLVSLLSNASPKWTVAAETGTASSAIALIEAGTEFDVALVDLALGAGSGLDVIRAMVAKRPGAAPIALTVFDDRERIIGAILAGAQGYLLKDTPPDRLLQALEDARIGGAPMTPSVARWVLDGFRAMPHSPALPALTRREQQVVELLCEGHTYAEVARTLELGLGTVQGYVKVVYGKLEVASKAELAAVAFRHGLVR